MITEQQIRDMEPGRELDELVAEKVMGWTQYQNCWEDENRDIRTIEPTSYGSFQPSSDISAATEMLEKFDSYQCTKMHNVLSEIETKYRVIVAANKNAAYGDTLPLAACRAALIAILRGGSGE